MLEHNMMESLHSSKVLVVLAILVLMAIALDFMRRVKRNRYEDIQMSSRRLEKVSQSEIKLFLSNLRINSRLSRRNIEKYVIYCSL